MSMVAVVTGPRISYPAEGQCHCCVPTVVGLVCRSVIQVSGAGQADCLVSRTRQVISGPCWFSH